MVDLGRVLDLRRLGVGAEETQGGNAELFPAAVEKVERDDGGGKRAQDGQKLGKRQVQEKHGRYWIAPERTSGPNTASSIGVLVDRLRYRPELRRPTCWTRCAYSSNAAV